MASAPPPRMSAPLEGPATPGRRRTPVGLIIGIGALTTCVCIIPILGALLFPVFAQARRAAQSSRCMMNLRQLGTSIHLYASDFDGSIPDPKNWMDDLAAVHVRPRLLKCPSISRFGGFEYGYAFNKELRGKKVSQVRSSEVLVFDSILLERNANSGLDSLPFPGRHTFGRGRGNHILHLDGSVEVRRK